jgi:hypothetical protein
MPPVRLGHVSPARWRCAARLTCALPADASPVPLRTSAHGSRPIADVGRYSFIVRDFHPHEGALLVVHTREDLNLNEGPKFYYAEFDHLKYENISGLKEGQRIARGERIASVYRPGGKRRYLPEHIQGIHVSSIVSQARPVDTGPVRSGDRCAASFGTDGGLDSRQKLMSGLSRDRSKLRYPGTLTTAAGPIVSTRT